MHWNTGHAREPCGEVSGLIELAFAESLGVQRHGDDGIKFLPREAIVCDALGENPAENFHNPDFAIVFQAVDQFADDAAAADDRDGALKMKGSSPAVRAFELTGQPFEGLRANLAAWRFDEFNGGLASWTKIPFWLHGHSAPGAVCGKEKREERFKQGGRHGGSISKPKCRS
jgi:hypothetical protein